MGNIVNIAKGKWARYSRYKISDDGYIEPVKGASFEECDSWENYTDQVWNRESPETRPPYLSFIKIGQQVRNLSSRYRRNPPDELLEEVCNWCSKWGVLGLLPHQVSIIELAYTGGEPEPIGFAPQRTVHIRTNREWITQQSSIHPLHWKEFKDPRIVLQSLDIGWPDIQGFTKSSPRRMNVEWRQYFPSIPDDQIETFQYPVPLSKEFWKIYREPIDKFLDIASDFYRVFDNLSEKTIGLSTASAEDGFWTTTSTENDLRELDNFLYSVHQIAEVNENGQHELRFNCLSLLGTLALMCEFDLTRGTRFGRCEKPGCGQFFRTNRNEALYCSPSCRAAAKMRRIRAAKKDAKVPKREKVKNGKTRKR